MPNIDDETRTLVPTEGKIGTVMVVGAGVSGIQGALDSCKHP